MWLLTCDGDLLDGKRIWLRPGTIHLLGRTSGRSEGGERIQYINHKSVSRKHLTLEVLPIPTGNSTKLFAKSELRVTDGSKIGTSLNGEKIVKETKTLDGKEYEIKLGSYEHLFHLIWHPVTLSLTIGSKKTRDETLDKAGRREALEQADIKLVGDYVTNATTHAVAKKRNTQATLQALIQGRWVVAESYLDAIVAAVKVEAGQIEAAIEQDFDAHWPSEEEHPVPTGGEPVPRPDSYLKPNPARESVFQKFTFVFLSQPQYDNLLPVITSGGGKALLREITIGESIPDDVVEYVREVAGRKHDAQFRLSQQNGSGGVVVVRMNERQEDGREFMRSIDIALDQRSIEQSEFLDAILTLDASSLRKALEEEPDDEPVNDNALAKGSHLRDRRSQQPQPQPRAITVADSPPAAPDAHQSPPTASEQKDTMDQASEQPPRKRNRRIITQSRFKGFDDFDPSQFSRAASGSPEPSVNEREASQAASVQRMEVDEPSQPPHTQQSSRKRPLAEQRAQDEEDLYDTILPGHAALKRRKLAAAQNGSNVSFAARTLPTSKAPEQMTVNGPKKKKQKELDVMAEVQKQRKAQEELSRLDEESLRHAMDGVNIAELKNLAQVEEMDIPEREPRQRPSGAEAGHGSRWDPSWNGRKNFKKFRRQGEQHAPQLRRVLVTLEEAPRKGRGMGDEYWLHSTPAANASSSASTNRGHRTKSQSQSQSQSQSRSGINGTAAEDGGDEVARFRRRLQKSREEDDEAAETDAVRPEEIAGGRPRDKNIRDALLGNGTPFTQTLVAESQRKGAVAGAGKRPAVAQGGRAAKKVRQSAAAVVNLEEDDDDGLKFRRRRG